MTDSSIRWKRLLAQVAIMAAAWAAILLGAALWWAGNSVWHHLRDAGWELWLATFGLFAASHLLRFVRWHWMLWVEGHVLPATRSLSIFLGGLALLPTPGRAGVAVRSLLLLREGVPVNVSLAAYFSERLFDLLGLVALAALFLGGESIAVRWAAALGAGIAGVVAIRFAPAACKWLAGRSRDAGSLRRALEWATRFFAHAAELVAGRWFVPYLLLGMASNMATGIVLWLAASRFGATVGMMDATGIVAKRLRLASTTSLKVRSPVLGVDTRTAMLPGPCSFLSMRMWAFGSVPRRKPQTCTGRYAARRRVCWPVLPAANWQSAILAHASDASTDNVRPSSACNPSCRRK